MKTWKSNGNTMNLDALIKMFLNPHSVTASIIPGPETLRQKDYMFKINLLYRKPALKQIRAQDKRRAFLTCRGPWIQVN